MVVQVRCFLYLMRPHTLTSVEKGWTNHGQRVRNYQWISYWRRY